MTQALLSQLTDRGWTIALAESLTAGYLCGRIAQTSGISAVLRGGLVAYDIPTKARLLGVDEDQARACDAVSAEVALAMAHGVRELLQATVGLSTTGFAEPWDKHRPHAFIGLVTPEHPSGMTRELPLERYADREARRQAVARVACEWLEELLTSD